MEGWKFVENTWLYGEQNHGCGVYNDGERWEGNVVTDSHMIVGIGPFPTKEEAMAACVAKLKEQK